LQFFKEVNKSYKSIRVGVLLYQLGKNLIDSILCGAPPIFIHKIYYFLPETPYLTNTYNSILFGSQPESVILNFFSYFCNYNYLKIKIYNKKNEC